jgi:hypothetical protein
MIPRIAVPAVAAVLAMTALAGCGGGSDVTDHAAENRREAARARLAAGDLPGRWEATPNGGTLNCAALAGAPGAGYAASDQMNGVNGSADNVVFVFRNALAARIRMQAILSPATRRCIGREMGNASPVTAPSTAPDVGRVGDDVHTARFPMGGRNQDGDVLDVVVVQLGRGGVVVEVGGAPAQLDSGLRAAVVAAAVRKLRAAIAG